MNKTIVLMFILGLFSCGDTPNTTTEAPTTAETPEMVAKTPPVSDSKLPGSPEALEEDGIKAYQESPEKSLPIFKKLIGMYNEKNNAIKASFSALSVASIYADNLNKPDSALIYAHEALAIWEKKKDKKEKANVIKYIGLLESRMKKYDDAIAHINESIVLYQEINFEDGIAMANLDLSKVYFEKKDLKKGEEFLKKSTDYWLKGNQKDKIFSNNLVAIESYGKLGNNKMVKKLVAENDKISTEVTINNFMKNKFEALKKHYTTM